MFNNFYNKDWMSPTLGAGIVTSVAVFQGQAPFVGVCIICFSVIVALIVDEIYSKNEGGI